MVTMQEAFSIACEAERRGLLVIAIGRFTPPEQITDETPWAVSVAVGGRPRVMRSQLDLEAAAPVKRSREPAKRVCKASLTESQGVLF